MPTRALSPCSAPGCPALTRTGPCDKHRKQRDSSRGTARQRGYDSRWDRARRHYLRTHPLCLHCLRDGFTTPATVVDHIVPHRGDRDLFWNADNWQPLCATHHNRKTGSGR